MSSFLIMSMFRIFFQEIYKPEVCSLGSLRGGVGWGLGTMFARQGDIRREGAPPATSEDLGGHSEQFAASEFFNVEVVEEFFNVKVVDEFFNIEVVTNVEWSSTTSRWWTSSSTSRWWTRCSCSPRSGSQAFRAFVRRQLLFFTASNKDQDQSFVNT